MESEQTDSDRVIENVVEVIFRGYRYYRDIIPKSLNVLKENQFFAIFLKDVKKKGVVGAEGPRGPKARDKDYFLI
jgi:hypothetical protein